MLTNAGQGLIGDANVCLLCCLTSRTLQQRSHGAISIQMQVTTEHRQGSSIAHEVCPLEPVK